MPRFAFKNYLLKLKEKTSRLWRKDFAVKKSSEGGFWGDAFKTKRMSLKKLVVIVVGVYILGGAVGGWYIYFKKPKFNNLVKSLVAAYPYPAAVVDGSVIPIKTLYKQSNYISKYEEQTTQKVGTLKEIRSGVLDQLIEAKLVRQELDSLGIYVPPKQIEDVFQNDIVKKHGSRQEIAKVLSTLYGMSIDDFKKLIRAPLEKDTLINKGLVRIKVSHILVSDEQQAKDLAKEIDEAKRTFEDIAKEYSKDVNTRDKGGSLGYINRGTMPEEFDKVAFSKDVTLGLTLLNPVKTEFGWHIIRVEDRKGTIDKSYEDWLADAKREAKIWRVYK